MAAFRERFSALQCTLERCMRTVSPAERADHSSNGTQENITAHVREKGQELLQKAQVALDEFLRLAVQNAEPVAAGSPGSRLEEGAPSHTHYESKRRAMHNETAATRSVTSSTTAEKGDAMEVDLVTEVMEKRCHQPVHVSRSLGTELEQEVIILDPDEIEEEEAAMSARVCDSHAAAEAGSLAGHSSALGGHHGGGSGCGQQLASAISVAMATGNHDTTRDLHNHLHKTDILDFQQGTNFDGGSVGKRPSTGATGDGATGDSVVSDGATGDSASGDGVEEVDGGRLFVQAVSRAGAGVAVAEKAVGGSGWDGDMGEKEADEFEESFQEFDDLIMEELGSQKDFLSQGSQKSVTTAYTHKPRISPFPKALVLTCIHMY